jgi:prepilin-type N-terminal cleavage/methylation domain-containing protein
MIFTPSPKQRKPGFTLIELMIVCAIMSLLAAILIPGLIRSRERARKAGIESAQEASKIAAPPPVDLARRSEMARGALPVIEAADIKMSLAAHHQRLGMDVYTRYEATYEGHFVIERRAKSDEPVFLDFQFPAGTTEARNVSLTLSSDGTKTEPEGLVFDQKGIVWAGQLPGKGPVSVDVSFIAQGRDRFEYSLPPARRIKSLEIRLMHNGASSITVPDYGLQPTSMNDREFIWQFGNLVTDRPIVLELPGAQSPLGRLMLISKLVGLAVLLFGAGFWYLAELYEVGRLNNFRLGHFLLLALTYSLFFVIFAVIGFHGDKTLYFNILIAAIFSLPLLILHVSRVIDSNFALTRTLPLALFTLGIVLAGVYGGVYRDYIFIGATFIVIAFVTLTFRRWSALRDAYVKERENSVGELIDALDKTMREARELDGRVSETIASTKSAQFTELIAELKGKRTSLAELFNECDGVALDWTHMLTIKEAGLREMRRVSLQEHAPLLNAKIAMILHSINSILADLGGSREQAKISAEAPHEGTIHCLACSAVIEHSAFCPHCGTAQPRVITCAQCGTPFSLPLHMVNKESLNNDLFCMACGERQIIAAPVVPSP